MHKQHPQTAYRKYAVLMKIAIIVAYSSLPFRKKRKGSHLHPCRQPPLVFYAVFYLSVSEKLIQFPFHGARLGEFQRIRLTDMVGGDAVILCKAQNAADGNAVDDLGRGKSIDLLGKDFLS